MTASKLTLEGLQTLNALNNKEQVGIEALGMQLVVLSNQVAILKALQFMDLPSAMKEGLLAAEDQTLELVKGQFKKYKAVRKALEAMQGGGEKV